MTIGLSQPCLIHYATGKAYPLEQQFLVGRKLGDLTFSEDSLLSRHHFSILYQENDYYLVNQMSRNGTFLNQNRLTEQEKVVLKKGDQIRAGNQLFIFETESDDKTVTTVLSKLVDLKPQIFHSDTEDFNAYETAGFFPRLFAVIIDGVFVTTLSQTIANNIIFFLLPSQSLAFVSVLFTLFFNAVYFIFPLNRYGTTLGKHILKLKVIDKEGNFPSYSTIILREYLFKMINIIFSPITFFLYLTNKDKLASHDLLSATRVIKTSETR